MKLGADGLIALSRDCLNKTISLPTFNHNPVDTSGAGDAFLASSALHYLRDDCLKKASLYGSVASAIQISRPGNLPISINELNNEFSSCC